MIFTDKNYMNESRGTFEFIGNVNANELFTIKPKRKRYFKTKKEMIEALAKILNITDTNKIKLNYVSALSWTWDEVTSIHFTYEDKLIRISNHWSQFVNGKNENTETNSINEVGVIRSCWWKLQFKNKNLKDLKNNKFENDYFIGVIAFKDFIKRNRQDYLKGINQNA